MIELVRYLRSINILAKFENDPWKFTDVRVLTVIFHVRRRKTQSNTCQIILAIMKNPELIVINLFIPTFVPNLVILAWKWCQKCQTRAAH